MSIRIEKAKVERNVFICSDGTVFPTYKSARYHEMSKRILEILPPSSLEWSRKFRGGIYHLNKHMYMRCGIYHIILRDYEDLCAINYFFKGAMEALDYPEEFPMEFDLEIFHEDIPGTLMNNAQWRIYSEDNER